MRNFSLGSTIVKGFDTIRCRQSPGSYDIQQLYIGMAIAQLHIHGLTQANSDQAVPSCLFSRRTLWHIRRWASHGDAKSAHFIGFRSYA